MNGGPGIYVGARAVVNLVCSRGWPSAPTRSSRACHRRPSLPRSICSSNVIKEIEAEAVRGAGACRAGAPTEGRRGDTAASRGIARLARISDWADSRHNVFLRLSEIPLLFTLQLAYAAESWRHRMDRSCAIGWMRSAKWKRCCRSPAIRTSIRRIRFPRFTEDTEPLFEATEIAHPLLPRRPPISNSLTLSVQPSPAPQASASRKS